jgi:hypothetical protein
MIRVRERVLTISTLLAFMVLSGVAQAGPRITDKDYWLNEIRPQPREPDWRRAYALERGAVSNHTAPGGQTAPVGQHQPRYYGGPKSPMW